jgi:hypothetical protein
MDFLLVEDSTMQVLILLEPLEGGRFRARTGEASCELMMQNALPPEMVAASPFHLLHA